MHSFKSRVVATTTTAIAFLGISSIASADPGYQSHERHERHEIRALENRLTDLEARERFDINHNRTRDAVRTHERIEQTRRELRELRRS